MKKLFLLLFVFIITGSINAQTKAEIFAKENTEKLSDILGLTETENVQVYDILVEKETEFNLLRNKYKGDNPKILMHCFTGSKAFSEKLLTLNSYFSASGIITFKNSIDLQETFKMIENDKILIETDSPFLAPIPMRGKKNEPSFIKYTLEKLSELKSKTFDELETITNDNFERLFFQK